MERKNIISKACVIVIKDDKILLTYSKYGDDEFWLVPGGGIEFEESVEECAIREVKEETGLDVEIVKFLYLRDFIPHNGKDHVIDMFFLGKVVGGELIVGGDPDHNVQKIKKVEFVPIHKLSEITIFPKCLPKLIEEGLKNNFSDAGIYIGKCD